jgi:hypothetical protein
MVDKTGAVPAALVGRRVRHRTRAFGRLSVALLAGLLVASGVEACISDQRYSYWILNDTDNQVVVDVREQLHSTYLVPPHSYGALFAGMGAPGQGWTLSLVDEQCLVLQSWPVDADYNLVYVDPDGRAQLASDNPWSHGLRSATSSSLAQRDPPCDGATG